MVRRYGACGSAVAFRVRVTAIFGGKNSCAISVVEGERGFSNYSNGTGAVEYSI